jgi:prolipoprotein diacylglyceryltransferase/protein-S-isoprenylcysteine O-methyltransferase Ste14
MTTLAKLGYAVLFIVLLPAALVGWAARLDVFVHLPAYASPVAGACLAVAGFALLVASMISLRVYGGGLPMSPFPPKRHVTLGPYRFLRHPIYVGTVLVAAGLALALGSAAGLWIVTPLLAAAAAAWVLGYERDATRAHFGATLRPPLLGLPPASDAAPTGWQRVSVYVLVFLPWAVLFEAVELLGTPPDALIARQGWEASLPVLPWTEVVYASTYPFVLLAPLVAPTTRDLRSFMTKGWLAMALIIPLYLLLPLVVPAKPVEGTGPLETLLRWERLYDDAVTAFPSFHAVWALFAAQLYRRRWPALAVLWFAFAIAVAVSCVTTGMHATADVVGSVVAFAAVTHAPKLWGWIRDCTERLANSWKEVTVGPMRLLSHGLFAAAGTWLGLLIIASLAGANTTLVILAVAAATIIGAAIWAQVVEGSPQLLRPYGYYGGIVGGVIALLVAGLLDADVWRLLAAFAVGGSVTQAVGRGRCLIQGCCHGAASADWLGIRYSHPRSRVTRLSALRGVPLHPTQLYSAAWMLLVAAVLFRMWTLHAGLQFITGMYLILSGLGRFVEEHFRGEPQTATWRGLRSYQWLAIACVVIGATVSVAGWEPAPAARLPSASVILGITAFGALTYFAYGCDFPRLNTRFSRLV